VLDDIRRMYLCYRQLFPDYILVHIPHPRHLPNDLDLDLARAASLAAQAKRSVGDDGLWHDLCVPPEELRPANTLTIGQCFNWRQAGADCWVGVVDREVIAIRYREAGMMIDGTNYGC